MKSIKEEMSDYLRGADGTVVSSNGGFIKIKKTSSQTPLLPTSKWEYSDDKSLIRKLYEFRTTDMRNRFVSQLLEYETSIGHFADITINQDSVKLEVQSENRVTNLDKEYARWSDSLYRDIVYEV
jgi:pterin-4a-carbinolamine dehydratase